MLQTTNTKPLSHFNMVISLLIYHMTHLNWSFIPIGECVSHQKFGAKNKNHL